MEFEPKIHQNYGSLPGGQTYQKSTEIRNFLSTISNWDAFSVIVQSLSAKATDNFAQSTSELFWPKKAENLGKKSPKIQGGTQHDQFWNLSSAMDCASHGTKIDPLDLLEAEKFGVKILNLKPDF